MVQLNSLKSVRCLIAMRFIVAPFFPHYKKEIHTHFFKFPTTTIVEQFIFLVGGNINKLVEAKNKLVDANNLLCVDQVPSK